MLHRQRRGVFSLHSPTVPAWDKKRARFTPKCQGSMPSRLAVGKPGMLRLQHLSGIKGFHISFCILKQRFILILSRRIGKLNSCGRKIAMRLRTAWATKEDSYTCPFTDWIRPKWSLTLKGLQSTIQLCLCSSGSFSMRQSQSQNVSWESCVKTAWNWLWGKYSLLHPSSLSLKGYVLLSTQRKEWKREQSGAWRQ